MNKRFNLYEGIGLVTIITIINNNNNNNNDRGMYRGSLGPSRALFIKVLFIATSDLVDDLFQMDRLQADSPLKAQSAFLNCACPSFSKCSTVRNKDANFLFRDISTWQRLNMVFRERGGFFGLYRGIVPGSIRSFLANGCAMIVMTHAQRKVSELGLRG